MSHSATELAFRSARTSTGRYVSKSTRTVPYRCRLRSAKSSIPSTETSLFGGPGNARTRRNKVERPTETPSADANLDHARPANASAIFSSIPRSSGVSCMYRLVSPLICSTNIALLQSMFTQTKRRTCSARRLGWLPIAASANEHSYRLCTRFE